MDPDMIALKELLESGILVEEIEKNIGTIKI